MLAECLWGNLLKHAGKIEVSVHFFHPRPLELTRRFFKDANDFTADLIHTCRVTFERSRPALLVAVYRDIHDTPTALWKLLHIIPGQRQVNGSQVEPRCISSDQERMIDSELWRWIGVQLPRIRVGMETWQFKSNSCFSWPQQREHFHSPETTLNWNVWICALMCVWLFSLLICG